jgi:hypothetical protein
MVFKIRKGKHSSTPFRFGLWFRKKTFTWRVKFYTECIYQLNGVDQADTNKLIGVGYLSRLRLIKHKYFNRFWFYTFEPMQWTDSARFGWRYDPDRNKIELLAYCYVNRNRITKEICFVDTATEYRLRLEINNGLYVFKVMDSKIDHIFGMAMVNSRNFKNIKYRLGVYFGGNQPAPKTMYINLQSL